jgi:hypothetical protein
MIWWTLENFRMLTRRLQGENRRLEEWMRRAYDLKRFADSRPGDKKRKK